jgi:hypothetical protein
MLIGLDESPNTCLRLSYGFHTGPFLSGLIGPGPIIPYKGL